LSEPTADTREYLKPSGVAEPSQPYTHAIRVGKTVYLSGQVPIDANGDVVGPAIQPGRQNSAGGMSNCVWPRPEPPSRTS